MNQKRTLLLLGTVIIIAGLLAALALLAGEEPELDTAAVPAATSPVALPPATASAAVAGDSPTATVESLTMPELSLEQQVGQTLMVHFDGLTADSTLRRLITECHVGGIILFGPNVRDPNQVQQLVAEAQALAVANGAPLPLFVAVDQEGWPITRLGGVVTTFPSNMAVAATGDLELARQVGKATGLELRRLGINMNLAPVLDVNTNPDNPVIGLRSFGSDPQRVAQFGVAMAGGLQDAGVMAVGKHFPGHGSTVEDSHLTLPRLEQPAAQLAAVDLVPFQAAIEGDIGAIMTAHIVVPDLTNGLPATLSSAALTDLLRTQMGYEGLIATDSLGMGAIVRHYGAAEAAIMSLEAGADLLMYGNDPGQAPELQLQVCQALQDEARRDAEFAARVAAASDRILQAKQALPPAGSDAVAVDVAAHHELARAAAASSVTVVRDELGQLPLPKDEPVLWIFPEDLTRFAELAMLRVQVQLFPVERAPGQAQINEAVTAAQSAAHVVVVTVDGRDNPQQAALVEALLPYDPVLVAMGLPYDAGRFAAPTALATYGHPDVAQEMVSDVLFGEIQPSGTLPVPVEQPPAR